ncbi:MAG: S-layer homology domain-containing protein [Oscillospiraceae bacterium]|nr:S-layer homology domain-containing protein [Oscillospiraceae bacterium]
MNFKKRLISLLLVSVLLLGISVSALAAGAGTNVYTSEIELADNLVYSDRVSYDGSSRVESYALETSPGGDVFPIVLACDTIYGGMTISGIVDYAASLGYNVLGAVNTDFFTANKIPMGIVVENGVLKSSPDGRNILTIDNSDRLAAVKAPVLTMELVNNTKDKTVSVSHFNKTRVDTGGTYLYSEHFSTVSTRTSTDGWAVIFKIIGGGDVTPNGTLELEVIDTYHGSEAQPISADCLVLTAATASYKYAEQQSFAVGDRVTLRTSMTGADYSTVKWATGAGDILAENGSITDSSAWDSSVSGTNPRTVVGIKPDGTAIYYVADGRKTDHSAGLTCYKAAEELIAMGCSTVVNFDGGGSSAMAVRLPWRASAKTVNKPSDGAERSCSTYILLCSRSKPDGTPARLALNETGAVVLTGSSIDLSYSAVDGGHSPVSLPGAVTASAQLGEVSGSRYTAVRSGTDTISFSSGGITGKGSIFVTDTLTELKVSDPSGKAISRLTLDPGETVRLSASGSYYVIPTVMDAGSMTWTVSENLGAVSAESDGSVTFTAPDSYGLSGSVELSAGGKTVSIPVTVGSNFTDISGHWAAEYITELYDLGVVTGTTETTFSPDNNIKRCDFILMLYRAAGEPSVAEKQAFTDVPTGEYYSRAITWAHEKGIAQGNGDGTFSPTATLTREQAFTFVYRALNVLGVSYSDGDASALSPFSDSDSISSYAVTPTATLVKLGIVGGSGGKIDPQSSLTRAQMAKILLTALKIK